jgi:formate dehydrogenase beta subunit
MKEKIMLVDVSKCTACRSCQVACKNWNELPADQTENQGSFQNPPNLNPHTYTLIRFQEVEEGSSGIKWHFRNDKCYHCTEPGCMKVCPVPGCIFKTPEGAVVLDSAKCIGCKYCYHACPFAIPQFDDATEKMYKCTFCYDRQAEGLIPACAKACPTGAITFGDKDDMMTAAYARAKKLGGGATVYGDRVLGGTHVMYVLTEQSSVYEKLPVDPKISLSVVLWKDILKPLSMFSLLGGIGASLLYYITKGPKRPTFEEGGEKHE